MQRRQRRTCKDEGQVSHDVLRGLLELWAVERGWQFMAVHQNLDISGATRLYTLVQFKRLR